MENSKNHIYKIDEKLAKIIINKQFYFSAYKQESEFEQLPGNFQRAISREASFQVKTLAQTEGFADILNKNNMEEAQVLYDAICEYYAHKGNLEERSHPNHPQNLFSILIERDSQEIAQNPFEYKDKEDIYNKTSRRAAHFNKRIAERRSKGILPQATNTIKNIINHVQEYNR